jgi:DNA-binding response OmpR family regulator
VAAQTPKRSVVVCTTLGALRRACARAQPAVFRVAPNAREVRSPTSVRALRELTERHAVVVQLTRDDDARETALLEAGVEVARADASPAALAARFGRAKALRLGARPIVRWGPLELDAMTSCVSVAGVEARLSPQLFRVLHALVRAGGEVVSRPELRRAAGCPRDPGHDLLSTVVRRLRDALGSARDLVHTEPGRGIRLWDRAQRTMSTSQEVLSLDEKSFPLHPSARAFLTDLASVQGPLERPPPRAIERARALLALDDGRSTFDVALTIGSTQRSVRYLRTRYRAHGVTCVFDAARAGRPTRRG